MDNGPAATATAAAAATDFPMDNLRGLPEAALNKFREIQDFININLQQLRGKFNSENRPHRPRMKVFDLQRCLQEGFTRNNNLPTFPRGKRPNLLLYGLEKEEHKNKKVYNYIAATSKAGPGALFGTSGAGKTRSVLEYLSHHYGLYLVAGKDSSDPGSEDLNSLLRSMAYIQKTDDTETKKCTSEENLESVATRLQLLILVRHMVFWAVKNCLGDLSPHEWLLLQLYPSHFFGTDIFFQAVKHFQLEMNVDIQIVNCIELLFQSAKFKWEAVFVDESQQLLRNTGLFMSSCGNHRRSNFFGILKGLLEAQKLGQVFPGHDGTSAGFPYPIFSGTGMSKEGLDRESASGIAKYRKQQSQQQNHFTEFEPQGKEDVKAYLSGFLDFSDVSENVQDHLGNWLRGRPRWAATFVEEFLVREKSEDHEGRTRGSFDSLKDQTLIESLDCFLSDMTKKERRPSWEGGNRTAFTAFETFTGKIRASGGVDALEKAVYDIALEDKNETLIRLYSAELITTGLAALHDIDGTGSLTARIDEPIIVEAGIQFYNLGGLLLRKFEKPEGGGKADAFEKLCLCPLRDKLMCLLNTKFPQDGFHDFHVSTKSCYGVIARSCKGREPFHVEKTMKWIKDAQSATFEGTVPPFCFADDIFGPDIVCLACDKTYKQKRVVLCQAKYPEDVKGTKARASLNPRLFHHCNRTAEAPALSLRSDLEEGPCVQVVIQYPAHTTRAYESTDGSLENLEARATKKLKASKSSNGPGEDTKTIELPETADTLSWAYTVDYQNAPTFFYRTGVSPGFE